VLLAEFPLEALAKELKVVWADGEIPPRAQALLAMDRKARRYLADVMVDYWAVAIEPRWSRIRAVLEDDVAYRAGELTRGAMAVAAQDPLSTLLGRSRAEILLALDLPTCTTELAARAEIEQPRPAPALSERQRHLAVPGPAAPPGAPAARASRLARPGVPA
jgi:hypothetical protein